MMYIACAIKQARPPKGVWLRQIYPHIMADVVFQTIDWYEADDPELVVTGVRGTADGDVVHLSPRTSSRASAAHRQAERRAAVQQARP
jgi:hypothetical protein